MKRVLIAVIAVLMLIAGSSSAQTAFDFNAAYQAAQPGDVIEVPAGSYPEVVLLPDSSKDAASARVIFRPAPGASVTLAGFRSGSYGSSTGLRPGAKHFELRDMAIGGELKLVASEDVVLAGIDAQRVTFTCGTAIRLVGSDVGPNNNSVSHVNSAPGCAPRDIEIRDSVFHDFTVDDPARHSECLMVWPTGGQDIRVTNTVFRNCTDFNVLVKAPSSSGIVIERSFFDVPMPGDRSTLACNPGCPRGGNSIRYSGVTNTYPGSAVRNNVVNGGIGIDCNCVEKVGNAPGPIPETPPQTVTAPTGLSLTGFAESSIDIAWTPVDGADGYRLYVDGAQVGSAGASQTTATVAVAWGRHTLAVEAFSYLNAARTEMIVESVWRTG